jgi:hypothetical protein
MPRVSRFLSSSTITMLSRRDTLVTWWLSRDRSLLLWRLFSTNWEGLIVPMSVGDVQLHASAARIWFHPSLAINRVSWGPFQESGLYSRGSNESHLIHTHSCFRSNNTKSHSTPQVLISNHITCIVWYESIPYMDYRPNFVASYKWAANITSLNTREEFVLLYKTRHCCCGTCSSSKAPTNVCVWDVPDEWCKCTTWHFIN